ncbi:MAG: UvrABC system protein A [Pirellulaceae bacterium]|nr:MAG: UvrABC system protein A [Pirellulaceae bacterium]
MAGRCVGEQPVAGQTRAGVISVRGARVHNLQHVDVDLPREQLVVLTGPSGSGKSSLAFDTLYAEGQRQYVETLSTYARQFLQQLERPDVELIEGLPPTLCIDQRPGSHNPRSTVATVTEIYDYLRVLMARLGTLLCYQCRQPIRQWHSQQIVERLLAEPEGSRFLLLAPLVRGRRGQHADVLARARSSGFVRVRVDGTVYEIDQVPELAPRKLHHIEAVVDRVVVKPGMEHRLSESVELALRHGEGLLIVSRWQASNRNSHRWTDELFSTRYACPSCGISYEEIEPRTFSFNSPYGACPECSGLGVQRRFDPELVIPDPQLSIDAGALVPYREGRKSVWKKVRELLAEFLSQHRVGLDTPIAAMRESVRNGLLYGDGQKFPGVLTLLEKEYATTLDEDRQEFLESFRDEVTCPYCKGSRLRPEANCVFLAGRNVHDLVSMTVAEARRWFEQLEIPGAQRLVGEPLRVEIVRRLEFLEKVGVDYLSLDRAADTLSGGELQRVRLASAVGSPLIGVCYVLDEPSIGLHPRDNQRLIEVLRQLRDRGNTVVVVEHDEAMIRSADYVVDLGPGAGSQGGRLVACGSPKQIAQHPESLTGKYLRGDLEIAVPDKRRPCRKTRQLLLQGVRTNNLKDITVAFPLGTFICVTGVSGSGKSSLVNQTLARAVARKLGQNAPRPGPYRAMSGLRHIDKLIVVDQSPIGKTPRSNPATYLGVFDEIRRVFAESRDAKQRGFTASRFSFNVAGGRCEACQGQGVQKIQMQFLPDLFVTCSECQGRRYNRQTLEVRYRDRTIADVLAMSVDEAAEFFQNFHTIHRPLDCLRQVGLGYLSLGQPSNTLSGGEAQRVKLASELARPDSGSTLYILDEPTTGLHFDDIRKLLAVLQQLVDRGNTVVVIEHHLDVIKCADWVIDLGPEGGEAGGELVAAGTPEQIAAHPTSHTGRALRPLLRSLPQARDAAL